MRRIAKCLGLVAAVLMLVARAEGPVWAGPTYSYATFDVPFAGANSTQASRINDAGQIVGSYSDASGFHHGFLKDGATFTAIDVPGASYTLANGINNAGQIMGFYSNLPAPGEGSHESFLKDGATFTTINVPGAPNTDAFGINDAGQIVGGYSVGLRGYPTMLRYRKILCLQEVRTTHKRRSNSRCVSPTPAT